MNDLVRKEKNGDMEGSPAYRFSLYALVNHQGTMETGHYTALIKTQGQVGHLFSFLMEPFYIFFIFAFVKKWFLFDDHAVTLASGASILNGSWYMAFYLRENPLILCE